MVSILIAFIAYTFLWMLFVVVLISQFQNRPIFGKRLKDIEDETLDFDQIPKSEMDRVLEQVMGTGKTFEVDADRPAAREPIYTDEFSDHEGGNADKEIE